MMTSEYSFDRAKSRLFVNILIYNILLGFSLIWSGNGVSCVSVKIPGQYKRVSGHTVMFIKD